MEEKNVFIEYLKNSLVRDTFCALFLKKGYEQTKEDFDRLKKHLI